MRTNLTQNHLVALSFRILKFKGGNNTRPKICWKNKKKQKHQQTTKNSHHLLGSQISLKMILDFVTKVIPLNNMRNCNFLWGICKKSLWRNKKWNLLTHMSSHIVYKKKQQLILLLLKKPLAGFSRKKDIQLYIYIYIYIYRGSWLQWSKTTQT